MLIKIKRGNYINPEKVESLVLVVSCDCKIERHKIYINMGSTDSSIYWKSYLTTEEAEKALDELAELINKAGQEKKRGEEIAD